jgi:hypothetical protein
MPATSSPAANRVTPSPTEIDHPGEVLPDDDRVQMLHHASGHPRGHERVVSVHGGLVNADPHLARSRLGGRDLDHPADAFSSASPNAFMHPSLLCRWVTSFAGQNLPRRRYLPSAFMRISRTRFAISSCWSLGRRWTSKAKARPETFYSMG